MVPETPEGTYPEPLESVQELQEEWKLL